MPNKLNRRGFLKQLSVACGVFSFPAFWNFSSTAFAYSEANTKGFNDSATRSNGVSQKVPGWKIPESNATSNWGIYGVPPESPDQKQLCYALYPQPIDLSRTERYADYEAELWVCQRDGTNPRRLFKGRNAVHNGMMQSWVDNQRIVLQNEGAIYIVNAETGHIDYDPFEGFDLAHYSVNGRILMYRNDADSKHQEGLYEFDTNTNEMRQVIPYSESINHVQYSPDGRKCLFTTHGNSNLALVNLDGSGLKVLPGKKPMHFQWFDNQSFFGYTKNSVVGYDPNQHKRHELYRWNLDGQIIEHLAGYGCHCAARADREYFLGESWYGSDPVVLRLYARGQREPLAKIFSHSFKHLTWDDGGRHHVNPSFSRDGMRIYCNKAVAKNVSHAFCYDISELVESMK